MTSKTQHPSPASQKSSRHKASSRTNHKRTSSTNVNGYQTPNSTQSMAPKAHCSTASQNPIIAATVKEESQSPRSLHPRSFQSVQNPTSISSATQQYHYPGYVEYAAAVTDGAINLGIEVPEQLQQGFVDRHGQHSSWSVAAETGSDHKIEATDFHSSSGCHIVPHQQVVRYGYEHGELGVDLVGIGGQFDHC